MRSKAKEVVLGFDKILTIRSQVSIHKVSDLIRLVLEETYCAKYYIHTGAVKMYHDLSKHY